MRGKSIWLALALGCLILSGQAADSRAGEAEEIGLVRHESAALDGALTASGEVVLDRGLVRTELGLAMVHLDNGQVLKLEPNSAARFEAVSFDEVRVTVFSGRLVKWSAKGRPLTAGAGSKFTLGRSLQDPMAAERALLRVAPPAGASAEATARGLER